MVVALIALGIALGGTAVAGGVLITGSQIKDHSVGMVDLSNTAVARLRGQRGPAGPPGAQGSVGAVGAAGPAGLISAAKINVQRSDASIAAGGVGQAQASCPAGSFVLSGGGYTNGQGLWESTPFAAGTTSGWATGAIGYSTIASTVTAIAICVLP